MSRCLETLSRKMSRSGRDIFQAGRWNKMRGIDDMNHDIDLLLHSARTERPSLIPWRLACWRHAFEQYTRRRPPNSDGSGNSAAHTAQPLALRLFLGITVLFANNSANI